MDIYGVITRRVDINDNYSIFIPYDIKKGMFLKSDEELDEELSDCMKFFDGENTYPSLESSVCNKDAVGFFITEEMLIERYPNLSLEEAKHKYVQELSSDIHFGIDVPSLDYTKLFKMDFAKLLATKVEEDAIKLIEKDESLFVDGYNSCKLSNFLEKNRTYLNVEVDPREFEDLLSSCTLHEVIKKLRVIYDEVYNKVVSLSHKDIEHILNEEVTTYKTIKDITPERLIDIISDGLDNIQNCRTFDDVEIVSQKLCSFINDFAITFELVDCDKEIKNIYLDKIYSIVEDLIDLRNFRSLSEIYEEVNRIRDLKLLTIEDACTFFTETPKIDLNKEVKTVKQLPAKCNTKPTPITIKKDLKEIFSLDGKELIQIKEEVVEKTNSSNKSDTSEVFDVKKIKEYLDRYVVGQEEAKRKIIQALFMNDLSIDKRERSSVLLIGPTGSGKSLIAEKFAEVLDRPSCVVDATNLTSAGYKGADIEESLIRLMIAADGDLNKAQKGIVIFDEIDKKGSDKNSDVSGRGVINLILSFMNGAKYTIKYNGENIIFDTSKLTVIATGAFTEVAKLKNEKLGLSKTGSIGFHADFSKEEETEDIIYPEIDGDDLEEFGKMPKEYIGRISLPIVLQGHTRESLKEILYSSDLSPLKTEKRKLMKAGILIGWTTGYVDTMVEKAFKEKTGARSLKKIFDSSISCGWWYSSNSEYGYTGFILTKNTIDNPNDCILIDEDGKFHKSIDIIEGKKRSTFEQEEKKILSKVYKATKKELTNN